MNKIVEILKRCGPFSLATSDGKRAHVRPFNTIEEIAGEIYLCTANTKDVFQQMMGQPEVEICCMISEDTWVRLTGRAVRVDDVSVRQAILDEEPDLKENYAADDGVLEAVRLEDVVCMKYCYPHEPERIEA